MKTLIALLLSLASAFAFCANPRVELVTTVGVIVLELDEARAPKTVTNFLSYVREGFYDGTIFHRVIDDFMIQGGGLTPELKEKPTRAPIENEANNGLKNVAGAIAMARTRDPHSASAQFFINLKDNPFLDHPGRDGWGYAVFGRVVKGFDVVQKIGKLPTTSRGPHQNVPVTPVIIEKARILSPTEKTP
ncbi:MAG: peptidylprolyl isomerase [Rhodocyclaceae bacterium]|nr:peptidylprolyl isomerase [Rhodocyclaceae bacterium]